MTSALEFWFRLYTMYFLIVWQACRSLSGFCPNSLDAGEIPSGIKRDDADIGHRSFGTLRFQVGDSRFGFARRDARAGTPSPRMDPME